MIVPFVVADSMTLVSLQVIVPSVTLTLGACVSSVSVAVAVAVHPLDPSTVTVYVPEVLTAGVARLLENQSGPDQPMIVPFVVADN